MSLPMATTTIETWRLAVLYTRCNHPARLEAGTESLPGRRYHLRAVGDEGEGVCLFNLLPYSCVYSDSLSVVCLLLEF
jgi:hypothetical protein